MVYIQINSCCIEPVRIIHKFQKLSTLCKIRNSFVNLFEKDSFNIKILGKSVLGYSSF